MGVLDRLWNAISDALFGDVGGSDARHGGRARARTGERARRVAARQDRRRQDGDRRRAHRRPARRGRGRVRALHANGGFYDVPPEAPLLRFLDTRGLGEAGYDPAKRHFLVRGAVAPACWSSCRCRTRFSMWCCSVLHQARRRHPDWPIVVAQTGLHRLYPAGMGHPPPYPYTGGPEDETQARSRTRCVRRLPISARCSTGCAGRRRASCRSISPCRRMGFRRTTTGSKCCGGCWRRSGPALSRRCTARAPTPRATASARRPVR